MTVFEMQGVLRGKAIPADMKVNESLAEYLVRKFSEKDAAAEQLKQQLEAREREVMARTNECAVLLPKAASELSNSWVLHKYWVGINAALMHLEMGRVEIAQEWLRGTLAGPGLESPELEEVDDIDTWAEHQNRDSISHARALEILKEEAPTTASALAEAEANGVEKFADAHLVGHLELALHSVDFAIALREGRV